MILQPLLLLGLVLLALAIFIRFLMPLAIAVILIGIFIQFILPMLR